MLTSINLGKRIESDCAEGNRLYGQNATTSVTSPITRIVSVEQQLSHPENISHDPADYFPGNFTENNHEIWIYKGFAYIQNKHYDLFEASRTYKEAHGNKSVTMLFNKALFIRKLKNNGSVERKLKKKIGNLFFIH